MPELTKFMVLFSRTKIVGKNVWWYYEKCVSSRVKQRWPRWKISLEEPMFFYQRIPGFYYVDRALSTLINVFIQGLSKIAALHTPRPRTGLTRLAESLPFVKRHG